MVAVPQPLERFSRRDLFGSGFGRALDAHFPRRNRRRRSRSAARADERSTWGETDSSALAARLRPARRALIEAVAAGSGGSLLDVSAGDGRLAAEAAAAGWAVTAVEGDAALAEPGRRHCDEAGVPVRWLPRLPAGAAGGFDAVVSCFADSHSADQRRVARMLTRSSAPGAAIGLTAWKGLMASVMQITAPDRHGRSEDWSRRETARAHFGDRAQLSLRQHYMCWEFADEEAAVAELSAPGRSATGRRRLSEALPDLIEMYGRRCQAGLALRADYVVIIAHAR